MNLNVDKLAKNWMKPPFLPISEIRFMEKAMKAKLEMRLKKEETASPKMILKYWTNLTLRTAEQKMPNG